MPDAPEKLPYVLVADDERSIADTLRLILKTHSYAAVSVYSGEEALEYAAKNPPSMLISDVVMPGMNGFELAIHLKDKFPDCAVLLISGQVATAQLLEKAKQAGYDFELLAKPVHPLEILSRVESVFA
jgi:CheY-like chemotaxis protein